MISVQCSSRVDTTWLFLATITNILIEGSNIPGHTQRPGCVKNLGRGGVGTLCESPIIKKGRYSLYEPGSDHGWSSDFANDPLWVEVKQVGVAGPRGDGIAAPLLKGLSPAQLEGVDIPFPLEWNR